MVTKNFSHMQVFFILFSVYFAVYQYINSKCLYRTHVTYVETADSWRAGSFLLHLPTVYRFSATFVRPDQAVAPCTLPDGGCNYLRRVTTALCCTCCTYTLRASGLTTPKPGSYFLIVCHLRAWFFALYTETVCYAKYMFLYEYICSQQIRVYLIQSFPVQS